MGRKTEPRAMAEIHKIQEKIYEETKHMSTREKLAYFRRARKELGLVPREPKQRRRTA